MLPHDSFMDPTCTPVPSELSTSLNSMLPLTHIPTPTRLRSFLTQCKRPLASRLSPHLPSQPQNPTYPKTKYRAPSPVPLHLSITAHAYAHAHISARAHAHARIQPRRSHIHTSSPHRTKSFHDVQSQLAHPRGCRALGDARAVGGADPPSGPGEEAEDVRGEGSGDGEEVGGAEGEEEGEEEGKGQGEEGEEGEEDGGEEGEGERYVNFFFVFFSAFGGVGCGADSGVFAFFSCFVGGG